MRIFVTGATGVLGSRVVPLLTGSGHQVTAVARTSSKADALAAAGATPVTVDLFAATATRDAVAGHEVVLNLATHIPPMAKAARVSAWSENDRIRREASRNLVDAALATGADRFVQESLCFYYADGGDAWLDESAPLDPPAPLAGFLVSEGQAARFGAAGGTGVALRFGQFYGADSEHTRSGIDSARRGMSPYLGRRSDYHPTLHLDDAATAVVAALAVPTGPWNVAETEVLTKAQTATVLAEAVGRTKLRSVPAAMLAMAGPLARGLLRSQRADSARFREATGWAPQRAFAEAMPEIVRALTAK